MAAAGSPLAQLPKGLKLTKAERKMIKKQSKAFHTLKNREREVGEISDVPTPYLLVKNGGLMCGVERQDLVNVFDKYGKLVDLVMFPGKSYSYVLFSDTTSAEEAMTNLNGQKLYFNQTVCRTFYLAYLLKRPCTELCLSDKSYPAGMILIEDFISEHLELELLQCFSSCKEEANSKEIDVPAEQQLKHRYVKHFGYEFIYGSNNVDKDKPLPNGIPSECLPVMKKLVSLDCVKHEPDQLTINEYQPGQGIPPHVDTHSAFEDGIISVSLGAKVAMDFRHPDGRHVSVLLPRQSVLIMTEECRYAWTHGITPRKYDVVNEDDVTSNENNSNAGGSHSSNAVTLLPREVRLSLTFRKVRRTPCDCKYPANCDSQNYGHQLNKDKGDLDNDDRSGMNCNSLPQSEEDAMDLEKEHVHNVYENIAEHFSGTRHSPWPKIAEFLKEQAPGSIVADVGCGNGKYLGINDQLLMFGSDRSQNLAVICRERGYHVIVCDILSLPYRSNSFDVCICIAVIHHLSTAARRLAAIKELTRIIRPGGRILISVWALEQNLKNREKLDHSGKSTLTDSKICSTAEEVEKQRLEQSRGSAIASEGINSNVETTAGGAAKSVINDSVLSKQDLCSKASNRVDDFGYQNNVHLDKNPVSHHNEDTHTLNTSKLSSTSSRETDASRPGDASEILPPSKISGLPNCSSTAIETSSLGQGIHPKMEAISSIRECTSSSATSRDSSSKLKVNASRDVFEQQDLLIPWHYRGKKSLDKPIVEKDELELNSAGEEKVPKVFQRFYHVFKEHELADECRKLGNVSIVRSYYDKGNWCVELEKVRDN